MKKLISLVLAVIMVVGIVSMSITVSAVQNANDCKDSFVFDADANAAVFKGWTIVDTDVIFEKFGYSVDGGATVWTVTEISPARIGDTSFKDNEVWEDYNLDEAVVTMNLANGLEEFLAYRVKITVDCSEIAAGRHTFAVKAIANGEEFNPFRNAVYTFNSSNSFDPAEPTNSFVDDANYTDETEVAFYVKGWFGVTNPIAEIGYSIDGGDPVFDGTITKTVDEALNPHTMAEYSYRYEGTFALSGTHEIDIIAKDMTGANTSVLKNASGFYTIQATGYQAPVPHAKNFFLEEVLFEDNILYVIGWYGAEGYATAELGYKIDDGEPIFDNSLTIIPLDIEKNPDDAAVHSNEHAGHYGIRFNGEIDLNGVEAGNHQIMIVAKLATTGNPVINALVNSEGERPIAVNVEASAPLLIGDVNNDGSLNNKDVATLFKYLNGDTTVVINEEAADVNSDGELNNKDIVVLFRQLSES